MPTTLPPWRIPSQTLEKLESLGVESLRLDTLPSLHEENTLDKLESSGEMNKSHVPHI